jgi:hypothetical protein
VWAEVSVIFTVRGEKPPDTSVVNPATGMVHWTLNVEDVVSDFPQTVFTVSVTPRFSLVLDAA